MTQQSSSGSSHTVQLDAATHAKAEQVASKVGLSLTQLLPLIIKNALTFAEGVFADIVGGGGKSTAGGSTGISHR